MNATLIIIFIFVLRFCANQDITTTDNDDFSTSSISPQDVTNRADPDCVPGEVVDLNVLPADFSAEITWTPPSDNQDCVANYKIFLGDDEYSEAPSDSTSFTITDLNACSDYTVSVAGIAESGESGAKQSKDFSTQKPTNFGRYKVNNLATTPVDSILNITWDPPSENVVTCITSYYITITDQKGKTESQDVPNDQTYYTTTLVGCKRYQIQVYPKATEANPGGIENADFTANGTVANAPTIVAVNEISKNSINFTIGISRDSSLCVVENITINCDATDLNGDYNWIIKHREAVYDVPENNNQLRFLILVEGLSQTTNYSCYAVVTNTVGSSPPSDVRNVTTLQAEPLAPKNLQIINITSTSFIILWDPPDENQGNFVDIYTIWIKNNGPNHYVPGDCQNTDNFDYNTTEYKYNFNMALPHYNYLIEVAGINAGGKGEASSLNTTTLPSMPDEPENFALNNTIIYNEPHIYNVTMVLSWETPCNTNGVLQSFILTVEGRYSEDGKILYEDSSDDIRNYTIENNSNESERIYLYSVTDIKPSFSYNFAVKMIIENDLESDSVFITALSPDGYPGSPILEIINITSESFIASWQEPNEKFGKILNYTLTIKSLGPLHIIPSDCQSDTSIYTNNIPSDSEFKYTFLEAKPNYQYISNMTASTSAGEGPASDEVTTNTEKSSPEQIRDYSFNFNYASSEIYNANLSITFKPPCNLNGDFKAYNLNYTGKRNNKEDDVGSTDYNDYNANTIVLNLKPDYDYAITISVVTEGFATATNLDTFHSKPGVPQFRESLDPPQSNESTRAYFDFSRASFEDINGDILYYALYLMPNETQYNGNDFDFWDGENWPEFNSNLNASQITAKFWNPFEGDVENVIFIIGNEKNCSDDDFYCNYALNGDTEYALILRAFTSAAYKDSARLQFKTIPYPGDDDDSQLGLILGLVFGILALIILIVFIVILRKRQKNSYFEEEPVEVRPDLIPKSIDCKKFIAHYDHILENYNILKAEFTLLGSMSKELQLTTNFALLPENKRKNRYSNILPYDTTRVKLLIEEDDEMSSDYINASYIKGYSNEIEYIATQGPLESTCKDFWKMVIQENITVIVMLTQFVEQSKEKCFQYFPKNHETAVYSNYEVQCNSELDFGTYCVRTLQVSNGTSKQNVVHMQFLDWPDFGVPPGSDNILQFCCQMRERAKTEGGLIAVHCSAGVGRTGTIIATDILLQTIEDYRDINVFQTVLNLRKQRINMVQTEKQYVFIYTCIRDALQTPLSSTKVQESEPVYENLNILRSSLESDTIKPEIESAL